MKKIHDSRDRDWSEIFESEVVGKLVPHTFNSASLLLAVSRGEKKRSEGNSSHNEFKRRAENNASQSRH